MINVLFKDIILIKKISWAVLLYGIFISVMCAAIPNFSGIIYILGIFMIVDIFIMYNLGYDDKNSSDIVINSLPVKRSDVVLAKYLFTALLTLIIWALISFITNILRFSGITASLRAANLWDLIESFNIILIVMSAYLPVYFKLGSVKMKAVNALMYAFVFILPSLLSKFIKSNSGRVFAGRVSHMKVSLNSVGLMIFAVSIIIFLISFYISNMIYSRKDL